MLKKVTLSSTLLVIASAASISAHAIADTARKVDVPSGELAVALRELAKQSGVEFVYSADQLKGVYTPGVRGEYTTKAAVTKLLEGTKLKLTVHPTGALLISDVEAGAPGSAVGSEPSTRLPQSDQGSTNSSSSRSSNEDELTKLEEIVVTAQKRTERLQDVPISMSVLGGAELDGSTATSMTDVLGRVPGVAVNSSFLGGGSQVPIRGVAAGGPIFSGSSPTAYYLDSAPFGFSKSAIGPDPDVYDLERIEVLRGPQGTLYGASALNGVVRILTKDADLNAFELKTRVSGSTTRDGDANYRGDVAVNVPLVNGKLAARAVLGYQDLSGWIDSPIGRNVNDAERRNARIKINARPTEQLSIGLIGWFSRTDQGAPSTSLDNGSASSRIDQPISIDYDLYGLDARYEFEHLSISSATSYFDYKNHWIYDVNPSVGVRYDGELPATTFTQEINLSSLGLRNWRWTAGAIYRDSDDTLSYFIQGANVVRSVDTRTSRSHALFGELTRIFLNGALEITAGLRVFKDDLTQIEHSRANGAPPPQLTRVSATFDSTTPRLVVSWHPHQQLTAYASYGEGFRSGTFQGPPVLGVDPAFPAAAPDNLRNYELGVKGNTLERRVSFELATFYIDWNDVQQPLLVFSPVFKNYASAIINGESASGPGFEGSISVHPVESWELGANFSWNDLAHDADVMSRGMVLYRRGDRLASSSEYTAGVFADYAFRLRGMEGKVSASMNYVSGESHSDLINNSVVRSASDDMQNARISASLRPAGNWEVTAFVDNVTDEEGTPFRHSTPERSTRVRPRTAGIQLEYTF